VLGKSTTWAARSGTRLATPCPIPNPLLPSPPLLLFRNRKITGAYFSKEADSVVASVEAVVPTAFVKPFRTAVAAY